jgi:hypothetical protein
LRFILILYFLFNLQCTFRAQDTISLRNGGAIIVKVIEVSPTQIKYKKWNMPEEPIYIENKFLVERISYASGFKEYLSLQKFIAADSNQSANLRGIYNKIKRKSNSHFEFSNQIINESQLSTILKASNDKEIINLALKARNERGNQYIGIAGIAFAGVSGFLGLFALQFSDGSELLPIIGICAIPAVGFGITGIIQFSKHRASINRAIKLYNQK